MATTLRALERFGATVLPGGATGDAGGSRAGSVGPAGVYGQIFPPGIDERAAVHGLPPALQIGRIDIPPAHEDEFNEFFHGVCVGSESFEGGEAAPAEGRPIRARTSSAE